MSMTQSSGQPYSGIRIIDLTHDLAAYATRLFADLGADVIRVEPPSGRADRGGAEAAFTFLNVNKKSVTLDLASDGGIDLLRRLVGSAQVVVYEVDADRDRLLPMLMDVPGPRVVSVVSHFGLTGPYARYLGCDLVDQALGGIAWLSGRSGEPPLRIGGEQSWIVTSIYTAVATAAALWDVELRGARHMLDVSAQEAIAHSLQNTIQMYDIAGRVTLRGGVNRDAMEGIFACEDGYVFLSAPPFMGDQWNQIIAWMEEDGFPGHRELRDEKWNDRELRTSGVLRDAFKEIFERFLASKRRATIANESIARKILIAPVSTVADLPEDRQLAHRAFFTSLSHPDPHRKVMFPGAPYRMSEAAWRLQRPPPGLGADNAHIGIDVPASVAGEVA